MPSRRMAPGVFCDERGRFRVFVWVSGRLHSARLPDKTTLKAACQRREDLRVAVRLGLTLSANRLPTLGDELATYLQSVRAMPTFAQREQHLRAWVTALNPTRPRGALKPAELRAVLHRWRLEGLSPATCNKRRTALMHFYAVLDGRSALNPVRDVPRFQEPDALPRAIPYGTIARIFEHMVPSKTKARLLLVAYCGLPPAEIKRLKPEHVNLEAGTLIVPGRRKGAGTRPRVLPLTPQGLEAIKAFIREEAWGAFSSAPFARVFQRACKRIGVSGVRPYDLRHSFGTAIYAATGDLKATQAALGHSTLTLTERYALGAVPERLATALNLTASLTRRAK